MPLFRVVLEGTVREVYIVDAIDAEEAETEWFNGEYSHTSDGYDFEVVEVTEA